MTPWTAAHQASLSFTKWSLLKFMSFELMMPYNYLILCDLLLLLPSIFPSIRVFPMCQLFASTGQRTGASASASVLPMNIHSWFPFRIDQFDLLVIRGTLESLLQHRSLKVLILQYSAFFMTQLSHPHMTTGKTIASTVQTFVGKVMFLLFNMLSGLVIAFLPRCKHLLISWLQPLSAVILEPRK